MRSDKKKKKKKEKRKKKSGKSDDGSLGKRERIIKNRDQSSMFRRECSARRVRR